MSVEIDALTFTVTCSVVVVVISDVGSAVICDVGSVAKSDVGSAVISDVVVVVISGVGSVALKLGFKTNWVVGEDVSMAICVDGGTLADEESLLVDETC